MDVAIEATASRLDSTKAVLLVADGLGGAPLRAVGHPSERPTPAGPSGPITPVAVDVAAGPPGIVIVRTAALATSSACTDAGVGRRRQARGRWEVRRRSSDSGSAAAPDGCDRTTASPRRTTATRVGAREVGVGQSLDGSVAAPIMQRRHRPMVVVSPAPAGDGTSAVTDGALRA